MTAQNLENRAHSVTPERASRDWTRALSLILLYGLWSWFFRLLSLTWITHSLRDDQARIQDISETFFVNELVFAGFGSAIFILLWRSLSPIRHPSYADFLSLHRIEKSFFPAFLQGCWVSLILLVILALTGFHQVIGFYLNWEESPLVITGFLIRSTSLICLIYCEKFLFRHRLLPTLRLRVGDATAVIVSSVLFVGIKNLQFELGLLQSLALGVFSILLGRKAILKGDFSQGAGLFAGVLFVIHPLASLPVFGNDYQGLFLIKSQGLEGIEPSAARWLSGGAGGPFGSLLFLLLLGLIAVHQEKPDLLKRFLKSKKNA